MAATAVPGFNPKERGFQFANRFPSVPVMSLTIPWVGQVALGNAANGLCGGMALAAADYFHRGVPLPGDREPPAAGSALFRYIAARLVDSFDLPGGPLRYMEWMALPDLDQGTLLGIASRTRQEWPGIRTKLDAGQLVPIALIRAHSTAIGDLGKNHQVLAYGYDLDENTQLLTVKLYDPNHPGEDVQLRCSLAPGGDLKLEYWTGEPTRGFFATPYVVVDPRPATAPISAWAKVGAWIRAHLP